MMTCKKKITVSYHRWGLSYFNTRNTDQTGNKRGVAYLNKNNVNSIKNNPAREIPIPMYEMIPRICSCVALSACTVPA